MAHEPLERIALMAIHPTYAAAILRGEKRVEFRKRRLAPDVRVVLIYATAPVKGVIGAFEIESTHVDSPIGIWREYGAEGCIERPAYDTYYAGSELAVALRFRTTWAFDDVLRLSSIRDSLAVPQSFVYLELSALSAVVNVVAAPRHVRQVIHEPLGTSSGSGPDREMVSAAD